MDGSEISCFDDTLPSDHLSEWVIDMDAAAKEVDRFKEEADWKKPSIYRVTHFARSLNPNAFTPQVISFGPFHHGSKHLKATEEHKHRALTHFLHRAGKGSKPFVSRLQLILKQLQDSYKWIDEKPSDHEFLKMMLRDGCFMIEVLRTTECSDGYAPNDPVFSSQVDPLRMPYIKRDMLLLENQLPLLLLKELLEVEDRRPPDKTTLPDHEYINDLVLSYCGKNLKANLSRLTSHPLELYRMRMLHEDATSQVKSSPFNRMSLLYEDVTSQVKPSPIDETNNLIEISNAFDLWESGVRFKHKDDNHASLRGIDFDPKTGTLELPVVHVHDGTEHLLLNMVAYEQIQVGIGNDITSYVMFMDALIDTADDVKLLQKKKIIINSLASHKDVADLFNKLSKEATHDAPNDVFNNVRLQLRNYYKKRRNKWRASLRHQYFHNPWRGLSIIAASLVIFLTFIQTLYSVLTFHFGK